MCCNQRLLTGSMQNLTKTDAEKEKVGCVHTDRLEGSRTHKMDEFIYRKLLHFRHSHMCTHTQSVLASKLCWAVMNEWMFLSWILFTQQLTHTKPTYTHSHTLHIIRTVCNVQYFVLSTSPSQQLPDSFIFGSSLHRVCWMVVGIYGYWRGGVPPSLCQLPVTVDNRLKGKNRLLDLTSRCASHASFFHTCVCSTFSSKFKLTPGLCVCLCTWVSYFTFCVWMFYLCALCVCVQSLWLQALVRQRAFLFLWPLSKHIKNYLITAYTARSPHSRHTHKPKYTPHS